MYPFLFNVGPVIQVSLLHGMIGVNGVLVLADVDQDISAIQIRTPYTSASVQVLYKVIGKFLIGKFFIIKQLKGERWIFFAPSADSITIRLFFINSIDRFTTQEPNSMTFLVIEYQN